MSKDTIIALHAEHQGRWKNREEIAERMIALIGQLYREKNIVTSVYGRSLVNRSVIQILKAHRRTRMMDVELSVVHTFPIIEALAVPKSFPKYNVFIEFESLTSLSELERHYAFPNGDNGLMRLPLLMKIPENLIDFDIETFSLLLNSD